MKKRCDCVEKMREQLAAFHKSEIELGLKPFINCVTHRIELDLPPLFYWFKDGRKRKKGVINFIFCPFCGERIP